MSAKIYAHRGARRAAPENTLPAFQTALDMGVDGVELDVQCSSDGQLMVIHDFHLDDLTDGTGLVRAQSAADLAKLDAGSHFSADYAGVSIPTLDEVMDLLQGRCVVNVEIKSEDPEGGAEVEPLIELINQRGLHDQVIVSSFNPTSLIKMRWMMPEVKIGLLYYQPLPPHLRAAWMSKSIDPQALHPYYELIDDELLARAREGGYAVNTWTVNEVEDAIRLAALGVDVIMTDVPDVMIDALSSS